MLKLVPALLSKNPTVVVVLITKYVKLKRVELRCFQMLQLLELPVYFLKYRLIILEKENKLFTSALQSAVLMLLGLKWQNKGMFLGQEKL